VTDRTVRILIGVGVLWIVLGIVRLAIGGHVFGAIGIALGTAMVVRGLMARGGGPAV
jgi:hypothetical protein